MRIDRYFTGKITEKNLNHSAEPYLQTNIWNGLKWDGLEWMEEQWEGEATAHSACL